MHFLPWLRIVIDTALAAGTTLNCFNMKTLAIISYFSSVSRWIRKARAPNFYGSEFGDFYFYFISKGMQHRAKCFAMRTSEARRQRKVHWNITRISTSNARKCDTQSKQNKNHFRELFLCSCASVCQSHTHKHTNEAHAFDSMATNEHKHHVSCATMAIVLFGITEWKVSRTSKTVVILGFIQ